jgi:hypothetical protein
MEKNWVCLKEFLDMNSFSRIHPFQNMGACCIKKKAIATLSSILTVRFKTLFYLQETQYFSQK